jgi:hypothetical protein
MFKVLKTALLISALLSLAPLNLSLAKQPLNFVMGPLGMVTDFEAFKKQLLAAKELKVDGITTDVWWGVVEKEEGHYDFEYYKEYARVVKEAGLKWIPIISTHSAQIGNVNDNVDIPIPAFAWTKGPDMAFKSSTGKISREYLSIWAPEAEILYKKFMVAFRDTFAPYNSIIEKIYIGVGPSGELRYPSYGGKDWHYPDIGELQVYSDSAKASFRKYLREKYKTIDALNASWKTVFNTFSELGPPTDGNHFFVDGFRTPYGKDFLSWQQESLVRHLKEKIADAREAFAGAFDAPLAVKKAGIHWKMSDPVYPRAAEYAAGYYNYEDLFKAFGEARVDVTFTCLEMNNRNFYPDFSLAEELVKQVVGLAEKFQVKISGENAVSLDFARSWNIEEGFKNIHEAFKKFSLSAFTFLRLENLVHADGSFKPEAVLYQKYISQDPLFQEVNLRDSHSLIDGCAKALSRLRQKVLSVGGSESI